VTDQTGVEETGGDRMGIPIDVHITSPPVHWDNPDSQKRSRLSVLAHHLMILMGRSRVEYSGHSLGHLAEVP